MSKKAIDGNVVQAAGYPNAAKYIVEIRNHSVYLLHIDGILSTVGPICIPDFEKSNWVIVNHNS